MTGPPPTPRDHMDVNRGIAITALNERDQARRELAVERGERRRDSYEPLSDQPETIIELRGRIVGQDRDIGHVYFKGCDANSDHWPWTYTLHWSAEPQPTTALDTLAAIDLLHQPDPDTPTACQCGATGPCPTRRELDR